jgi:xeroderma pigmentosum group C-complementing protein
MLAEAGVTKRRQNENNEGETPRPLKRKRPGERRAENPSRGKVQKVEANPLVEQQHVADEEEEDEDEMAFEDVAIPKATVQTMERDTDDEEDEDEMVFEDVPDMNALQNVAALQLQTPADDEPKMMKLDLAAARAAMGPQRRAVDRRKALNKEQKQHRVEIHKMHLLCLIFHVSWRNRWCNDRRVQSVLRPLLTGKMIKYLNPPNTLSQFGRTESLRNGIQEVADMWKMRFTVTEKGMKRALWAEDEEQLQSYELPDDMESTLERRDFLEAARTLQGSRDVGAQLFCALLRSAGVKTRLVCSLQPLACVPGAPTMPRPKQKPLGKPTKADLQRRALDVFRAKQEESTSGIPSARRRLGHPNAAAYNIPIVSSPSSSSSSSQAPATKRIHTESPFPIYWVEVLDVAHQKWAPVDPLVTCTQWKPRLLEPPASDRENLLSYVVAFSSDGSAKDVTRRYAKAYNSKTRKQRIDGLLGDQAILTSAGGRAGEGERWWRRMTKIYQKRYPDDVDSIEDVELNAAEAKEGMPRNVADFKDHPVYALERHLRRNEVLIPGASVAGTVGAGSKGLLERIYRRRDVRVARTRERWYRLGRVVKPGEEPVKTIPKKRIRRRGGRLESEDEKEDEEEDDPDKVGLFGDERLPDGSPLFMFEQTDLYVPPPVVDGRVPKNKFGNLDIYTPSMVPKGGAYIEHERAGQAAFIARVDYAPALTGFQFKGRKGTAVLRGAVVPKEAEEGVKAIIEGLEDLGEEMERERRTRVALRMWSRFLKGLRIRQRIWAGVEDDEEEKEEKGKGVEREGTEDEDMDDAAGDDAVSDVTEELDFVEDDDGGGGFLVDDDDGGGGGFMIE